MPDPSYSVARAVSGRLLEHFAGHHDAARAAGRTKLAPVPDQTVAEALIDAAFWASLRREEGLSPRISLAFVPPELAGVSLQFRDTLPLHPAALAKLAPAVERASIHLGVWRVDGDLRVWGTTRSLPPFCFVIEVAGSGLLVIKQRSDSVGKFVNVAVLEGDQIKIVNEGEAAAPECPPVLRSLLGFDPFGPPGRPASVMVELAAAMRSHGRGGTVLRVPADSTAWQESAIAPFTYAMEPPYRELARVVGERDVDKNEEEWRDALRHAVEGVAGLTAVDGATVINDRLDVLAFGVKIRPRNTVLVSAVVVTEPIEGRAARQEAPARLGGTRHLSAAQFVFDQRDAVALVASQDGNFTIFRWSQAERMVHAHRVEALLL